MAEIEVPDYKTLTKLPSGSTISLFNDRTRIYNVNMDEVNQTILLPKDCTQSWDSLFDNDKTYWFTMLTREEYNGMLDENNEVKFLAGGLRSHNGWEQLVFLPTVEEALCFGAYHVSQGHVGSTIETIVLGFSPNEMNLAYNLGQRKVSHFQRAQSIQFLQIHNPFRYKLSDMERDNVRVMSLDFCPADKFQVYTWNNGWMWYFGHPVHARTMLEQQLADPEYIHTTLLTMCLQHLGQYGTTMMEETTQRLINNFRATMGLDTMFVDRDPEAQRGHDNHKAWIMKNQHKGDDKEEIEDKMDDDNDDGDNDDAMGEGKKRKFQQ